MRLPLNTRTSFGVTHEDLLACRHMGVDVGSHGVLTNDSFLTHDSFHASDVSERAVQL